ncbi:cell division protein FtsQ/DivIB [Bacillus sp. Marseille-P3800]|uniref:cell division protein FtsQ/DivIB n=1 Tax=Bacillus sp. Marseille-P3800 TaxID=2014782 RepID=UPI00159BAEE2|nr:FtsQ-type POTRA domain-containing protein [Bacillus sp. Marseille-P3800]
MSRDEKVVSVNERIPTLQEKRRRKANKRLLSIVIVFFFLIMVLVYFQSPLSEVKAIHVEGNQLLTEEEIRQASGLSEGMNIWNIDKDQRINQVAQLKEIESVEIHRTLPSSVQIQVEEYPRVGYVYSDEGYLPLLQNGQTLDTVHESQLVGDAPILVDFEDEETRAIIGDQLMNTAPEIVGRISEIIYTPTEEAPEELTLYMTDGIEVRTDLSSFAEYMQPYPQVHAQVDSSRSGVLYMKMSPYFRENETAEE